MITVFLIDDDGSMREMLARFLEKEHFSVKTFASPLDALDAIRSQCPDLVISDIQMPGMSGLELAETLRNDGVSVPVLLMTGHVTDDVKARAVELGVVRIYTKPIRDLADVAAFVRRTIRGEDVPGLRALDRLRWSFFTGLSHELRTPLTAIKLALENISGAGMSDLEPTQQRMLGIGRRNVGRMIATIERQLDLLQVSLGEVSVARRLVDVGSIVHRATGRATPGVEGVSGRLKRHRGLLFTDPERLLIVVQCLLETLGGSERQANVTVAVDGADGVVTLEFSAHATGGATNRAGGADAPSNAHGRPVARAGSREDEPGFERRAVQRIVELLGGSIEWDDGDARPTVRVTLPVFPSYDRRLDFEGPLSSMRKTAERSGNTVVLLRCQTQTSRSAMRRADPVESLFLERCVECLSEVDSVVRGDRGEFYVALLDRSADEIDRVVRVLSESLDGHDGAFVEVVDARTLTPEEARPGGLNFVPEPAR
jgi:CheY-like chemotaxis protein